jgi:putative oxidoreductase
MKLFHPASPRATDVGLTVLRLVTGTIFMMHGGQKLFVFGLAGVSEGFAKMGLPMPGLLGPFIGLLEFFGGLALIIGLLTRLASLGLVFNMIGAILTVHLAAGFFLPSGYEFALALLGSSLALVFAGAGRYSIDAVLNRRFERSGSAAHPAAIPTPATKRAA